MVRSRLGLKVLGLCALALGLMAFAASGAQAETNAHWNIVDATGKLIQILLGGTLTPLLEIKELENKTGTLEFKTAGGTLVKILCPEAKFDEGGNLIAHGGISLGRIHFTGCKVELNSAPAPACEAHTAGKSAGLILTLKGKGLIVLDKLPNGELDELVKLVPDEGKLFAKIEMGVECAIGEFVNVEAKSLGEGLWIKDCGPEPNKSFLEEKVEHLIEESSLHGLIALGQPAVIEGSALVRLGVGHVGLKWGGTPA